MTTRNTKPPIRPRRRPFVLFLRPHDSNTSSNRNTIVTPGNGRRLRIARIKVLAEQSAGRRLIEFYFGTGSDITTNPEKAVDTLDIPDLGQDETRTYLRGEGPRGLRNEILSGRWKPPAPSVVYKIMVEYEEEA